MFVILAILSSISAAWCGACVLGYFIDYHEPSAIILAICFAIMSALYMRATLRIYRESVEKNNEEDVD